MTIDKKLVRRAFAQQAKDYDSVAVLQREVGERLLERLDSMSYAPHIILDVGAGTGFCTQQLAKRYPTSQVIALDLALPMLREIQKNQPADPLSLVCADAEQLPLAPQSVDIIFANLVLQWCPNLIAAFQEIKRVLKPKGLLLFSTFGPDTLKEVRACWAKIDDQPHVHDFMDMHDVGDLLHQCQFLDPVMDREEIVLTYDTPTSVLKDLKNLGATYHGENSAKGLLGRDKFRMFLKYYKQLADDNQKVPATFEVVYGHALGATSGEVHIPLSDIGRN